MKLFDEIKQAIAEGKDAFFDLIQKKQKEDKDFLNKAFFAPKEKQDSAFIVPEGRQLTVLEYLIYNHSENSNLIEHIEWLLQQKVDVNANEPLHLIFRLKKMELVPLFLNQNHLQNSRDVESAWQSLNLNARDATGKRLIYRIIESRNIGHLNLAINYGISVHLPSPFEDNDKSWEIQPLHQAIITNFSAALPALIEAGAQLSNPFGQLMETPLLLAARLGRITALKALLVHYQTLSLESNREFISVLNKENYSAMDLLCIRMHDRKKPKEALRGIAMLLCHGADVPAHHLLRSLLMDNRHELFVAIKEYSRTNPQLAANFLRKCLNKTDPLHDIIFAKNSWSQTFRHLFGKADDLGFQLQTLINLSNTTTTREKKDDENTTQRKIEKDDEEVFQNEELLFANFVGRYKQALKTSFFNPWSEMLHLIASGEVTCWKHVTAYADMHTNSRTFKIIAEMKKSTPTIHVSLDTPAAANRLI
ncbi:hypothetical protein A8135_05500 [Legionella jamestowniensis]|uniref:Ankyrin repeats (3 copies) n=1 Tax=Legionella jamestowniensis TaxID=455 RepID=A0ABX2XR40_9GAMM|nr:Dot/Icm T4SS effector AnkC/LegA12 [Legionella jamestowniensis]OCH97087.1 hypothetical protein A8135_05500 [Legionella jamestowniensis]